MRQQLATAACGSDTASEPTTTGVANADALPSADAVPSTGDAIGPDVGPAADTSEPVDVTAADTGQPDGVVGDDATVSDTATPSDTQGSDTTTPDTATPDVTEPPASDPGRVTLHRLNRAEYNNTVRDLLGTTLQPADDFPNDDHGYGFDNIADVLAVSPLLFELYDRAAETLVEEALYEPPTDPVTFFVEAEDATASTGGASNGGWNIWSNGTVSSYFNLPYDGTYRIAASAYGQQAGPDLVGMAFLVDGVQVATFEVANVSGDWVTFEVEVPLTAGLRDVAVAFLNDFYEPDAGLDRNLIVDWFQISGPNELLEDPPTNPIREALLTCSPSLIGPDACIREIVTDFGRRAWRRPLANAEVDALAGFLAIAEEEGEGFEAGLRLALRGILASPHFVFRVETDPDPNSLVPHPLTDHELATRLSYFLWSSMPDAELSALADAGELQSPEVIAEQTRRMLKNRRAVALVDNFAGQWLYLRALEGAFPDLWAYPSWNEDLRASMDKEARLFVESVLLADRSMMDLLTSPMTFIDERLAQHYGIPVGDGGYVAPEGDPLGGGFVEMDVSAWGRGGFLRQAGIQTTLSYPTRTSPVKRGKWVLGQLLCQEPEAPPPGVEGIADLELENATIREVMEAHRADPTCASCHVLMDPIGFGFEHFDGVGQWRDEYPSGFPVEADAVLPPEQAFDGAGELIELLAADAALPWCITTHLWTYALGRGPTIPDYDYLPAVVEAFETSGHRFEDLIVGIVTSDPFRMRRGETASADAEEE